MLTLHLKPVFAARSIDKPYSFLVKAGLSPHSAHKILNSSSRVFRLDHIETLCRILHCTPNELLAWTNNPDDTIDAHHPLQQLRPSSADPDYQTVFRNAPLSELKELASALRRNQEKDENQ